ncbi:MAG: bifunctional adenosylcobinamide kinase/adenosylcobinamide-phosphate guanylyltransferase, partial [Candidatus Omnitrophica bacterium]|nr:bifunctional adenosylcobinamide kinase/adenosylcobinamide-phosphate guanylyltransferase [Candidatus Omnitrophota bacterium]
EVLYIATCTNPDKEMKERIKLHKKSRPIFWKTINCSKDIVSVLSTLDNKFEVLVIDCLGLLISNLLEEGLRDHQIQIFLKKITKLISQGKYKAIVVSNDVGSGIVPDNYLARRFRDILGLANQIMAKCADKVIYIQAGIPMIIKGKGIDC